MIGNQTSAENGAPRARVPAMDFQDVIGAGGCEPGSGCEYM